MGKKGVSGSLKASKAVVVLPTYNEKGNIGRLIPAIEAVFRKIKNHDMHILVVDDSSPDGTANVVKNLQKRYRNLHLISGKKEGLGVAYLRGFAYAIEHLNADVMFQMDSDFSHPPELILQFMQEIDNGYDLVIGSRYIPGGATPDWTLKRKLISRGGNFFARVVGDMYKVHDCTSGFRAIKVATYRKIDTKNLATRGYAFMSTLLFELMHVGGKVKEIPLVFPDRKFGQTKMSGRDIREFFFNSFRLRFKSSKRMIKFMIVGGSGILVNLGLFALARTQLEAAFGASTGILLAASLVGDELSIVYNFLLNNFWTFKGTNADEHVLKKLFKFHVVALTSVVINNVILFDLHMQFGVYDLIAKFIGILVAFVWNYLVNLKWTWREKLDEAVPR